MSMRVSLLPALAALALAACGGDPQPIRPATADRLLDDLNDVAAAVEAERCNPARAEVERLQRDAGNVSDDVDRDVRQTLEDGVDRLAELVEQECEAIRSRREEEATTTTEPETTTETTTTEPETTTETTTTEPETTTTTPPPTETPPPTTTAPEAPPPAEENGGAESDG